ncbi:MAG: sigma-70 family RNA polymerase sigma factor [Ilumatobacteraceae bacterium]
MRTERASQTPPEPHSALGFEAFYRRNLPVVYGYLLRLCGGRTDRAQDLTQDTWLSFVDHQRAGHGEVADVRWLITVARSRYIDLWRRQRRLDHNLGLAWASERSGDVPDAGEPTQTELCDHLASLNTDHRLVLTLRYIDGFSVPEVASLIDRTTTATYSLLARARHDLRLRATGETS